MIAAPSPFLTKNYRRKMEWRWVPPVQKRKNYAMGWVGLTKYTINYCYHRRSLWLSFKMTEPVTKNNERFTHLKAAEKLVNNIAQYKADVTPLQYAILNIQNKLNLPT